MAMELDQSDHAVKIGLPLGMELEGNAADCSDTFQHRQRMAGIFGILKASNHRLRSANLPSELGLSQPRILPHLAHQQGQVNLMQGSPKGLTVGCALAGTLFDNLTVFVALHSPNSFRMASLSFRDPA